jgi:hypothetical protein
MCAGATGSAVSFTNTNSPLSGPSRFSNWNPSVCARVPEATPRGSWPRLNRSTRRETNPPNRPSRPAPAKIEANRVSGTHTILQEAGVNIEANEPEMFDVQGIESVEYSSTRT